jgi:predicted alpha-1,6-mannanase (GH76 family)
MKFWAVAVLLVSCGDDAAPLSPDAAVPIDGPPIIGFQPPGLCDGTVWHPRADAALNALLLHFWNGGTQTLEEASPSSGQPAAYWIFAQAWDALLDGAERYGGARYRGLIDSFVLSRELQGWTSNYYDDENWMALALIRAYDLTGETALLDRAEMLFGDIMAAWDTSCCGAAPGGIWWDRAHTQKATASNAGPVITGVRLAMRTGRASYAGFARQVYDFWLAHMVDPSTHQVADHIDPSGAITRWKFTYNEGLMIGAALELGELADAHAIAGFMVSSETQNGVLFDGANCGGDCMQFKGIGYRYLAALVERGGTPDEMLVARQSAEAIWDQARAGDVFAIDWRGPPPSGAITIQQQSSAAMALARWAVLCRKPPVSDPNVLEAEEAELDHIGIEASHGGFGGWGYVAGWNNGGRLTFPMPAGHAHLVIDYAAGAGDASRLVNGTRVAFPQTGSWDNWSSVSVDTTLPIVIDWDANYLNIDRITLSQRTAAR